MDRKDSVRLRLVGLVNKVNSLKMGFKNLDRALFNGGGSKSSSAVTDGKTSELGEKKKVFKANFKKLLAMASSLIR